jgi:hypothetical protein
MSFDCEKYEPYHGWYDCTFDDAKAIARLMGIEIEQIYFSGFCHQGQGACFTGSLGYAKGCAKAVKAYGPNDTQLHRIAEEWQRLHRKSFYQLSGTVKHSGRYSHEYCTSFDWDSRNRAYGWLTDTESDIAEELADCARDLMGWIYQRLEAEYEYQSAWTRASAWQELAGEMAESRNAARQLVKDMREAIRAGLSGTPSICAALRRQLRSLLNDWESARKEREEIEEDFYYRDSEKSYSVSEFAAIHF